MFIDASHRRLSVERRDSAPERLDVLPHLLVFLPLILVAIARSGLRQLQVFLEVAQRGGEVVHVIREQPAIAELADRVWADRQQQIGDGSRLRKRAPLHVEALQIEQHADEDLPPRRAGKERRLPRRLLADVAAEQRAAILLAEDRPVMEGIDDDAVAGIVGVEILLRANEEMAWES